MASPEKPKTALSATEARQGPRGMPVFVVLIAALILAAIVWTGVEIWGRHIEPDKPEAAVSTSTIGASPQGGTTDNSQPARPSHDGVQN